MLSSLRDWRGNDVLALELGFKQELILTAWDMKRAHVLLWLVKPRKSFYKTTSIKVFAPKSTNGHGH